MGVSVSLRAGKSVQGASGNRYLLCGCLGQTEGLHDLFALI